MMTAYDGGVIDEAVWVGRVGLYERSEAGERRRAPRELTCLAVFWRPDMAVGCVIVASCERAAE